MLKLYAKSISFSAKSPPSYKFNYLHKSFNSSIHIKFFYPGFTFFTENILNTFSKIVFKYKIIDLKIKYYI